MRLLLCEDERAFSDALCAILEHNNYTVDAVYDGEDAYAYGLSANYDGILLDIMMPKADGLTVLQKLRADRLDLLQQLKIVGKALDLCQMSRIRLDQHRARVGERIDRVAKTINLTGPVAHLTCK